MGESLMACPEHQKDHAGRQHGLHGAPILYTSKQLPPMNSRISEFLGISSAGNGTK